MTSPVPEQPPAVPASVAPQQVEQMEQQQVAANADELQLLAQELNKPQLQFDPTNIRKGIITSFESGGSPPTVTLNISGDTTTSIAGVRFIDSYTPVVGDTVLILKQGADIMVLGHIAEAGSTWTQATLASGFSHNGNSNGNLEYRRVFDRGSWKMQWRGSVSRTSNTTVISALGTDFRPASRRTVMAPRDADGQNDVKVDFNTDGSVSLVGTTTGGGSHTHSGPSHTHGSTGGAGDSHVHSHGGAVTSTSFVETHTHTTGSGGTGSTGSGGGSTPAPSWISFNGIEYFL